MKIKFRKSADGWDKTTIMVPHTLGRAQIDAIRQYLTDEGLDHSDDSVREFVRLHAGYEPPEEVIVYEATFEQQIGERLKAKAKARARGSR